MYKYPIIYVFLIGLSCNPVFGQQESNSHPLNFHHSYQYKDDLNGLREKRHIRVLTALNKTNFFLRKGKMYGFEYEQLKGYEKFLNQGIKKRELKIVLEFIPINRDELIPKLVDGYGDIVAAGLTVTAQRRRLADFTMPYLTGVDEVVVTHRSAPRPNTMEELAGRRVFVRKSSSYYESLLALNKKLKISGKPAVRIVAVDESLETEDILELVNTGLIDVTVCDSHLARIWSQVYQNLVVCETLKLRSGGKIAWMIRKGSPQLRASLNAYIKDNKKGTLLGNIYFKRYYKENKWIGNPMGSDDTQNFLKYKGLFQKYAHQYGFDWLLIAAMAYQESGLDNNKKNKSGAVGIMQVLPSTGKDKNIRISKVHLLENNIHAGVKYLAFLRDRYFSDPRIQPRNQIRFALASYNAGPATISRARTLAEEMGLDSNRWFRNVELAALKMIGQETVRYVSNINKYYVIYQHASESFDARQKEKKVLENKAQ
ncbi:Transglycosylase, Slt family [Olavius sp. associated proteobacterium Delta 1]|nr:Transglycosylase, Slt family [Olavius sp. associated proteobacterium Delta 1]